MIPYTPPIDDIRFILTRLIGLNTISALPGYEAVSEDVLDAVLDETAKMASEVFAPLNHSGDKQGAKLADGAVTMPAGFKDAYQAYVDGGWNGLPVAEEYGGQGLPWSLAMPVQEMLQSANLSLALCTLLNQGAVELLSAHGDENLKEKFLPQMVSGAWTGTMNLTEPQAGSDVGAVKCRATPHGDHYLITGQKIFISYGDHDMAENIIHLVLARLPDAPEGTKGLSLFLVPKILVGDDGNLGDLNDVRIVSIEHKLGQHASPTCVMAYGDQKGAIGYLVGQPNGGIAAMFTMMNNARIGVGLQGLALMERAYQQARDYALTRVQSRAVQAPKEPPVAIIHHPDVRRMLMSMRASIEAARALAYTCAQFIDIAHHGEDAADRSNAALRVDLLTPIVKSWLTDLSNEITSTGVQVFGGMGFIEETGAAQHMRDARVLAIYEGTNGIQANDLVFRKIARDGGAALNLFLNEAATVAQSAAGHAELSDMGQALASACLDARRASDVIIRHVTSNAAQAAAVASPYLRLIATCLGGERLLRSAIVATESLKEPKADTDFMRKKILTSQFYA
ncbi:MAG: acyl-CoA dehydrogenase, partial [Alphaproteobacteria bacterium]|nr:acyl-CoA dehydrogenase [Alphaproteobacteria bacterium]